MGCAAARVAWRGAALVRTLRPRQFGSIMSNAERCAQQAAPGISQRNFSRRRLLDLFSAWPVKHRAGLFPGAACFRVFRSSSRHDEF
jgi:hypothetical protein